MSRLSFALVLLVGILAGGLGVSLLDRGPAPLTDTDVRGIIGEMIAADKAGTAPPELDATKVTALVEDYLMSDPTILDRMSVKLAAAKKVAPQARRDRAQREARHRFYRTMLEYRREAQASVSYWRL